MVRGYSQAGKKQAAEFLRELKQTVPDAIHTILTDNGIPFTNRAMDQYAFEHIFDRVCRKSGIDHRTTPVKHPWTNGQVERMNRTIKEATIKRYHDDNHDPLILHLQAFVDAYHFAKRLKTLKGLTPYEFICKVWTIDPKPFTLDPTRNMAGLNHFMDAVCSG